MKSNNISEAFENDESTLITSIKDDAMNTSLPVISQNTSIQ
jgi:hypothetical protein